MSATSTERDAGSLSAWLPAFLQTTDPQFPTGGYAHSGGLEECVALGRVVDAETLESLLRWDVTAVLERQELPFLRFGYDAAGNMELDTLRELDAELNATYTADESRSSSLKLGRQRLKLIERFRGSPLVEAYYRATVADRSAGHHVVVCGLQAQVIGAPLQAALWAYLYQTYTQFLQASMKLIRIGQEGCQNILTRLLGEAAPCIEASIAVGRGQAGASMPTLDLACSRHATAFSRTFIS